jgi:hypothetical protein
MRPAPTALPPRNVASSGANDRSSQATPTSVAPAASANTAAVIIRITANGATVVLGTPRFAIPDPIGSHFWPTSMDVMT